MYENNDYFGSRKREKEKKKPIFVTEILPEPKAQRSIPEPKAQRSIRKFPPRRRKLHRKRFGKYGRRRRPPGQTNEVLKSRKTATNKYVSNGNHEIYHPDPIRNDPMKIKVNHNTVSPEIESIQQNINKMIGPLSPGITPKKNENKFSISIPTNKHNMIIYMKTSNKTNDKYLPAKQDERTNNHAVSNHNANITTSEGVDEVSNLNSERTSKVPMVLDIKYEPVRNNVVLRIKPSHARPNIDSNGKYNRAKRLRLRRKRLRKYTEPLGKHSLFLRNQHVCLYNYIYIYNIHLNPDV